jgi:hypothetical protein
MQMPPRERAREPVLRDFAIQHGLGTLLGMKSKLLYSFSIFVLPSTAVCVYE